MWHLRVLHSEILHTLTEVGFRARWAGPHFALWQVAGPLLPKRWRVVTGEQVARALLTGVLQARTGTYIVESEIIQEL